MRWAVRVVPLLVLVAAAVAWHASAVTATDARQAVGIARANRACGDVMPGVIDWGGTYWRVTCPDGSVRIVVGFPRAAS